jgi:hypothetical protein
LPAADYRVIVSVTFPLRERLPDRPVTAKVTVPLPVLRWVVIVSTEVAAPPAASTTGLELNEAEVRLGRLLTLSATGPAKLLAEVRVTV